MPRRRASAVARRVWVRFTESEPPELLILAAISRYNPPMSVTELEARRDQALTILRGALTRKGKLAVAFSGGVDSTLLLKLAQVALGAESVLAVTARSESLPQDELDACRRLAR